MKTPDDPKAGKRSIDLIEDAVHVLRSAPASTLAAYYAGAIPFIIVLLFFITDMSQDPFAADRLADTALVTTALFIWMKFCQAVFSSRLRMQFSSQVMSPWSFRQHFRVFLTQLIIQPTGFLLIPLSILLMAPFGWVYAFYQNVTVLADPDSSESGVLVRKALRQTSLWPVQNHFVIGILLAFGLFIFLNLYLLCFAAPGLLKQFFGIETMFSKSPFSMFNTTFLAAVCALTYLCVDPLMKTVYALRCFYGESLETGEDLKAGIRQFAPSSRALVAVILLWVVLGGGIAAGATPPSPPAQTSDSGISNVELNRRIDEVMQQRKYAWRVPREDAQTKDADKGFITKFLEKVWDFISRWTRNIADWIENILRKLFGADSNGRGNRNFQWMTSSLLLYILLAVVLSILVVYFIRVSRRRRNAATAFALDAIAAPPDISDENVSADQLPEDGWIALARDLLEKGQLRLATRAFYLASLAHLARRNLIGIARFKSNRDYENELRRRGHAIPEVLPAFGNNVATFERVWYGTHDISAELVQQFSANVERIRSTS